MRKRGNETMEVVPRRKSERLKERGERIGKVDVTQRKRKEKEEEEERIKQNETPWAPGWKPIEECRQFKNGMITRLLFRWWEPDHYRRCKEHNFDLYRFLKQVRETRGYEVDAGAPAFVGSPFNHLYTEAKLKHYLKNCPHFKESFPEEMDSVLAEINAQAEPHGKRYELHKVERLVQVSAHRCDLVTFSVKEFDLNPEKKKRKNAYVVKTIQAMVFIRPGFGLLEWRFKPESNEASCDR